MSDHSVWTGPSRSDRPSTLFDPEPAAPPRILSRDDCQSLFKRVLALSHGGGETSVNIDSVWLGNFRWARNQPTTAGDTTQHTVSIVRSIRGARSQISTNKFDDASLTLALRSVEGLIQYYSENPDVSPFPGPQQYLQPHIWSDASYGLTAKGRSDVARQRSEPAVQAQLMSAGYLQVSANTRAVFNTSGMEAYYAATAAEYSVTVRNPAGTGSGWAGVTQRDWTQIDTAKLTAVAQKKCVDSSDPVAVEPGRYTVILEPQAVHSFMVNAIYALDRFAAENFQTVYTLRPGQSKIGLKVFDERITLSTDPLDPVAGYIPFDYEGYPFRPVEWVKNGVLRELAYTRQYALSQLGHGVPLPNPYAYKMSGGTTSIDEMIATTRRGLILTRLNGVNTLDGGSLLLTGTSRDGIWLIENGKISKAVKNMRFTESPMFIFNKVQQLGVPVRVYAGYPAVVPPVKVDDFNFTSLSDSV